MQDRGQPQTRAARSPARGIALQLAAGEPLSNVRGLGLCESAFEWKTAVLARAFYRAHILPAAKKLGIEGIGWHTFGRHTYATCLKANGEDVKTVQELLRHANSLVTMNLYAQAITQNKRDAQSRIVTMVLDDNRLRKAQPSEGTFPCRTITDLQISGRDLQLAQSIGVPDGI